MTRRRDSLSGGAAPHLCAQPVGADRVSGLARALPPEETVSALADVFGLLSDPGRVRLLVTLLEGGEVCVHDLAAVAGQSESAVSHALRLLRAHRVVVARRSGRLVFYRLADGHVRMLLDLALTHLGHAPAATAVPPEGHPSGATSKEGSR